MKIRETRVPGYERVLLGSDDAAGYQGIIAIHSTALGPAVGGTRYWSYKTEDDAMTDALRLARGMTYKNALAGLPFGGGKSIILRDGEARDREQLFRAHGRMVNSLEGKYFTAEDVGTSPADMEYILKETDVCCGLAGPLRRSFTAYGPWRLSRDAGHSKIPMGKRRSCRKNRRYSGLRACWIFSGRRIGARRGKTDCYRCGPGKGKAHS